MFPANPLRCAYDISHSHPPDRRFFFALFNLSRFCVDTGLFHRPLTAGCIWVTLSADPNALWVGIFFELLWLDLFPAGAYIPPNGLLGFCLAITMLRLFPGPSMAMVLIILLGSALVGQGAASVELWYRRRHDAALMRLAQTNRRAYLPTFDPDGIVLRGIVEQWILGWGGFVLAGSILWTALALARRLPLPDQPVSWPILLLCALSAGGVLSLRTRRAWAVAAGAWVVLLIACMAR